jgi:hypothetical protein
MIRRFKIAIVIVLAIAILVPSILLVASEMQTFIFSKDLHVEDFVADVDFYIANITDSGVPVSHIYFRVEHATPNSASHAVRFSIWHTENTELDSMTLRFSNPPYVISLYLEASSYIWPDTQFNLDNGQAILSVKNLGWYGTGTITLDFMLLSYEHAGNLEFTADLAMHQNAFLQLTSLKAHAYLSAPIPS